MTENNSKTKSEIKGRIILPSNGKVVALKNIVYLEADRTYCKIWLRNDEFRHTSKPLSYFEKQLPENAFFRCHKSFIVNMHYLNCYSLSKYILTLKNGTNIKLRQV